LDTATSVKRQTDYFNYLHIIGLHQSAYNLLEENYRFQDIQIDRQQMLKKLTNSKKPTAAAPG
jgi:hypothetical protein